MPAPAYPIARAVAPKVERHIQDHLAACRSLGRQDLAPDPDPAAIEAMIDAGFWASLRREEGYSPRISLALLPPEQAAVRLMLEQPLPLAPEPLTRLAPAAERPGIHLGVWPQAGELRVWGATRTLPPFCFVLEVVSPGLLVIKHSRGEEAGKFANLAVLEGDQIKMLDRHAAKASDAPPLVASLLGLDTPSPSVNPLVQLAVSMRAHMRGGTLLWVPARDGAWRESLVQPIRYSVAPAFSRLADLMRSHAADALALRPAIDGIAGLTAVDGATVITDQYELLAFGAMIGRRPGGEQIEQVVVAEPIEGVAPTLVHVAHLGGTRHLSAAQFVADQRDAVALVASKDGRFTVFAWSPRQEKIHAHRVEALLL